MIVQNQIEQACGFIKELINEAFLSIDYEVQDGGLSILFLVELLRPLSEQEESLCEERMKELADIIPPNEKRLSPMVSCECRYGHGSCNYSFVGF